MRKVELRMNEELKYKVIKKLVETNGNKKRAAVMLNRSVRQIDRMIAWTPKEWDTTSASSAARI